MFFYHIKNHFSFTSASVLNYSNDFTDLSNSQILNLPYTHEGEDMYQFIFKCLSRSLTNFGLDMKKHVKFISSGTQACLLSQKNHINLISLKQIIIKLTLLESISKTS